MHSQTLAVALVVSMTTCLMAGESPRPDAAAKDIDAIQGTWKVVALEADGKQGPPEIVSAMKMVFKGDTVTFLPEEPGFTNYTFKLDPTTKPARFDMTHADGPRKGETAEGIYLLEGNHLKICLGKTGSRPKGFTTTAPSGKGVYTSGQGMYTLERETP